MSSFFSKLVNPLAGAKAGAPGAPSPDDYSPEVVDALAKELPEPEGVKWACQSARMVEDKLPPEEIEAISAAEEWADDPTDEKREQAKKAAGKTKFQGPGAWAAQAAAWSTAGTPVAGAAAVASAGGSGAAVASALTQTAVAGAVKLAAAVSVGAHDPVAASEAVENAQSAASPAEKTTETVADDPPTDPAETAKMLKPFIDLIRPAQ